ncbi:hypothetical protein CYMTET_34701 [Cymbomonas tetramitiformis]|uniref:Uncharacterized protein n=1 Tax=Cymbomonas tetramitiformis TaxID=36881 RepID=A0AAE0FAM5_9CHLO|nr:hypothetical protein CYMTET_34701 [Cymbomonas tetramitiformis]
MVVGERVSFTPLGEEVLGEIVGAIVLVGVAVTVGDCELGGIVLLVVFGDVDCELGGIVLLVVVGDVDGEIADEAVGGKGILREADVAPSSLPLQKVDPQLYPKPWSVRNLHKLQQRNTS